MTTVPRRNARPKTASPVLAIDSDAALARALLELEQLDPQVIGPMVRACAPLPLRRREPGLEGLVAIVVSQQVSTASARAIFTRVHERFAPFSAAEIAAASDEDLRACGLSLPKMRTIRAVALAAHEGRIDLAALARLPAEEAHRQLTALHGVGPWTAEIYLLFCLGHPDILPAGDLALQEGARLALGLKTRPDAKKLARLAKRWQPLRAVAARLLWAYYGHVKGRSGDASTVGKAAL